MRQLTQKLIAMFARRRANRIVDVRIEPGAEIAWAEDSYLDQILLNLITNADKYSAPELPIEIEISVKDGEHFFRVLDRGPGVRRDRDRPHLRQLLPLQHQRRPGTRHRSWSGGMPATGRGTGRARLGCPA